ncbi:four helix bundle protein [bacterium]|nr:four helix bundle protein [bacterium]
MGFIVASALQSKGDFMKETIAESPEPGRFEFQKWAVYENAQVFVVAAYKICGQLPRDSATGIRDQLRRASQSIPLNIAEGSARYTGRDKGNFFRIARGSVFECVAILDSVQRLGFLQKDLGDSFKLLETISRMLSGLIGYVEGEKYKQGNKSASPI